jgi:predicted metalloprotease with PDZ domain
MSKGKRSLDDFARGFFGGYDGKLEARRYGFDDVIGALGQVQTHDWAGYLRARIDTHGPGAPLDGLARAGWKLVYSETPNLAIADAATDGEYDDFRFSLGLSIANDGGKVNEVLWDGPAYRAGIAKDMQVVAVNDTAYKAERLQRAITAAKSGKLPIELLLRQGESYRSVRIDYHEGLRYPHLERIAGTPDRLQELLAPRK